MISPGADGRSLAEVGKEFLTPKPRRSLVWYGWQWPEGWSVKPSAYGPGIQLVDYLPCEGTRIDHDGVEYRVSWTFSPLGHELLNCPVSLLDHLGKRSISA